MEAGALLGAYIMQSFGESPSVGVESALWQILEEDPPLKYSLSVQACEGILRRSQGKGKELPKELKEALEKKIYDSKSPDPKN